MSQQPNGAYDGPPPPQEESGLDIQRYLQVLLKRKWLILSTLVVVLGAVAVWTFTRVKILEAKKVDPLQIAVSPVMDNLTIRSLKTARGRRAARESMGEG